MFKETLEKLGGNYLKSILNIYLLEFQDRNNERSLTFEETNQ